MQTSITKRFAQLHDNDVLEKVRAGEVALFEIIIRRYNPYLYKIGRSYGYRHAETEDLMQDTFVSAYFSLTKFENRSTFKTWIIRIMLNNCYQRAQKFSYKREIANVDTTDEKMKPMFCADESDLNKSITNKELGHVIERAISTLPIEYRMVFSLREVNGMSTSETAEAMEISEANVKVRLNRAKRMLRSEIEKRYAPDEIFEFNLVHCDPMVVRVMNQIETALLAVK